MPRRTRTMARSLTIVALMLTATVLIGQPALAAGVADTMGASITPSSAAPTTSGLTSEDMARTSSPWSKWLWIVAPVAILAMWFGLNRLWRTPAVRS